MRNRSKTTCSLHVALGTVSVALCFAAWGLISAFAPQFRKIFELTPTQSAALVAAPVLLGSLARIPVGMLTDLARACCKSVLLRRVVAVSRSLLSRASLRS